MFIPGLNPGENAFNYRKTHNGILKKTTQTGKRTTKGVSVPLPAEVQSTFFQNHRKHKCDLIINMFQVNVENRG